MKQGCPVSCFLFVVVFEVLLCFSHPHNICLSTFVDHISSPTPPTRGTQVASLVQRALSLIGCQLNVSHIESFALTRPPATPATLPKYSHPPSPMYAASGFRRPEECLSPPAWADCTMHEMQEVPHLLHLGHPLRAHLSQSRGFRIVLDELRAQMTDRNAHLIQPLDRVATVNTAVLLRLLYWCECLPLTSP